MDRVFRYLKPDEIECRVSTINQSGLSLLLFKDARTDQTILDETFGIFGWQRSHQLIGDRLYCTVSIRDKGTGEWISKQDVGTESYTEKEKGQASDSFKRACFNLGIGRELYTAPFIWIRDGQFNRKKGPNGKDTTYDRFRVSEINYTDGKISRLTIINTSLKNQVVFQLGDRKPEKKQETKPEAPKEETNVSNQETLERLISKKQALQLRMMCKHHEMPEEVIFKKFNRKSIDELTLSDWVAFGKIGQELLTKWDKEHEDQRQAAKN